MDLLRTVGVAAVALCLSTSATLAEDYQTALSNLDGKVYTIDADCSGDLSYSASLNDPADASIYLYVNAPETPNDDWTEACNGDGKSEPIKVEVYLNYGSLSYRHAGPGKAADAISLADFFAAMADGLAGVTNITGKVQPEYSDLTYTALAGIDDSSNYVYHDYMPKRTTIEYLYACFDICETVTFELEPLTPSSSGGSIYLYATGWSSDGAQGVDDGGEVVDIVPDDSDDQTGGKDKDR
jgi:hypothetical protein